MFGGTPKPTASLSSSLLARKGHAKPAMRPQGFVGLSPATAHDDLGWNDMGDEFAHAPAPAPLPPVAPAPAAPVAPQPRPQVLRQIEELDEKLSTPQAEPAAPQPASTPALAPAAAARLAREVAAKKTKAAFTLRLDHDRHLRLRLASAVTHRSAQQIVTEALDAYLESLTEVEALARQIGPGGK